MRKRIEECSPAYETEMRLLKWKNVLQIECEFVYMNDIHLLECESHGLHRARNRIVGVFCAVSSIDQLGCCTWS